MFPLTLKLDRLLFLSSIYPIKHKGIPSKLKDIFLKFSFELYRIIEESDFIIQVRSPKESHGFYPSPIAQQIERK